MYDFALTNALLVVSALCNLPIPRLRKYKPFNSPTYSTATVTMASAFHGQAACNVEFCDRRWDPMFWAPESNLTPVPVCAIAASSN